LKIHSLTNVIKFEIRKSVSLVSPVSTVSFRCAYNGRHGSAPIHGSHRSDAHGRPVASLEEKLGEPAEAAATLDRINYIFPIDEELHRHLGDLWLGQKKYAGAIREYAAVVALHPLDKASAQFNLARAYFAAGQREKAEEHLLASLEAAPGSEATVADRGLREEDPLICGYPYRTECGF
jgi:tetratricopeptide (TPR) repeat protein